MAVPGHPADPRSAGANALIREGAVLVRGIEDVIAALRTPVPPPQAPVQSSTRAPARAPEIPPAPVDMLTLHRRILQALTQAPLPEDLLIRDLGLPPAQVAPALLFLELDGRLTRSAAGVLTRA
jgi:DNA processing protein